MTGSLSNVRLLYLTRERHPSLRPDITVLFGRELPRHGVQTDLVALGDAAVPWPAGASHIMQAKGRIARLLAQLFLLMRLGRLARGPVDAVQARDRFIGAWFAMRAARRAGKPFFYWMSLPFPEAWIEIARTPDPTRNLISAAFHRSWWGLKGGLSRWLLYRYVLPHADHLFAQSDAMVEALVARGIARSRVTPVPMGIDVDEMAAVLAAAGDPRLTNCRYAVYLGALERARRPELLVQAFALLSQTEPNLLLVLAGDSQDAADRVWLSRYIAERQLSDRIVITGWLPPQEARAYVRGAVVALATCPRGAVYDMASTTKMAEYLALGVPVVANDQPDQAWLLAKVGGGVSVPMTPEGLAAGMRTVLAERERFVALAADARRKIEAVRSYRVIGAALAESYRRCIAPATVMGTRRSVAAR